MFNLTEKIHPNRPLTDIETQEILTLTDKDITKQKIIELFAQKANTQARFNTYDTMVIPVGYWRNEKPINTTVGKFVFNVFIVKPNFFSLMNYHNEEMNGDNFESFETELSSLLMDGKINTDQFGDYLNRVQWLGFGFVPILSPSASFEMTRPLDVVMKRKKELLEQYKEELKG